MLSGGQPTAVRIRLMVGDTVRFSQPTVSRLCKQVGEAIIGLAAWFIIIIIGVL